MSVVIALRDRGVFKHRQHFKRVGTMVLSRLARCPNVPIRRVQKGQILYSVVSGPQDCSKRFTLSSQEDLSCLMPSQLLWKACSHILQLMREDCSYTYPPRSIARSSFIELSELEQCRVKQLLTPQPGFEHGFS